MRLAHFDCFSGASGDMILGALVDAGFAFEELERLPAALGLAGVSVVRREVVRGPFRACQVDVRVEGDQPHRHLQHVTAILESGALPASVIERARAVFTRLAEAEAKVHGTAVEEVHFHEVGAADAIVDIAGACLGLERLGIAQVFATPPVVGRGTVHAAHGTLPVPAPATAALLEGIPVDFAPVEGERLTPTGAALLSTWVSDWSGPPPFRLERQGVGAGGRDPADRPNVLRVFLGTTEGDVTRREIAVIETTMDDERPQTLAHVTARLLEEGARDTFVTPVVMKKSRPGALVTVLCDPDRVDRLVALLFRETTTIGLRVRREERRELPREAAVVRLPEGEVELKVVTLPGGGRRARPEHESLAALARTSGRSLDDLAREALAAWDALEGAPRR